MENQNPQTPIAGNPPTPNPQVPPTLMNPIPNTSTQPQNPMPPAGNVSTPTSSQNTQTQTTSNSLLDQIIATSKENTQSQLPPNSGANPTGPTAGGTPPPQKPRDPMSTSKMLKLIGTFFLVGLIFLGTFLSYIVFNPDQAGFFNTVFGIDPNDIANILKKLVNVSFGIITFALSIVFIITLFRAIWAPKDQKRNKISKIIVAVLVGVFLFSMLGAWAVVFAKIQQTNFTNPGGDIIVYDNDIFVHEWFQNDARLHALKNIVGPITLRYKIDENARRVARQTGGTITGFDIDFDGAKCQNGSSKVTGSNPTTEEAIICTFDQIKDYKPRGEYTVSTYNKEEKIQIPFSSVEIKGLLDITEQENKDGEMRKIFDAQRIKSLGTPRWYYLDGSSNTEKQTDIFSETLSDKPLVVGLKVFRENNLIKGFDRIFIIQSNDRKAEGKISVVQNVANPQEYNFTVSDLTVNQADILSIDWKLNDSVVICAEFRSSTCAYTFTSFGNFKIDAVVNLIGNKTMTISERVQIDQPLNIERHVKINNRSGKVLNPQETYDMRTQTFIIKDIVPPDTIVFDARDVISSNPGYVLKGVTWNINDGHSTETRTGDKIDFPINRTARYTITAEYTFEKSIKTGQADDTRKALDKIMLDLERKNLTPILKISQTSDYVPARVTVDASQSMAEYSEIIKFIFDFGEGRPPAEGDAIQTYQYTTPGQKTITVTAVDSHGEKATTKETVVLKETPRTLNFTTSLSPGIVNQTVDFRAEGTSGQVEDYLWNFGDNTPISHGYEASHTFSRSGEYTVTLTVRYTDGTERSTLQKFSVVNSLE